MSAATTFRVGLLGHGIGPSLTPAMHVEEATLLGLDYTYEVFDLLDRPDVDLGAELTRLEELGYAAVNVTHPFKQQVLAHVDERSDAVARIGATNLVLLGERRVAHNTDYRGFLGGLEGFLGERPRGTVLQVGAGGAGLATACALIDLGFERIVVHDRSEDAVGRLIDRFQGNVHLATTGGDLAPWLGRAEGVVHVTPTGMREHPGIAFDVDLLAEDGWVAEVVYRPLETELVRRARARGLATLDGGAMAVGQAVESLRLITGRDPDDDRVHAHFERLIAADAG
ncbi:shikimate dehydrogenase [Nocardioides sp. YIM 152588]|uniref:shikimate dehydrogenase n=1 Tax=Nocardioides sp. YIM 152588 TaxID=3158259 RepID=UPI0032E4E172